MGEPTLMNTRFRSIKTWQYRDGDHEAERGKARE